MSSEDTEEIPVDQAQGDSGETSYTRTGVVVRAMMQISLFNHQLIMLCLARKDKGSAFNILSFLVYII